MLSYAPITPQIYFWSNGESTKEKKKMGEKKKKKTEKKKQKERKNARKTEK